MRTHFDDLFNIQARTRIENKLRGRTAADKLAFLEKRLANVLNGTSGYVLQELVCLLLWWTALQTKRFAELRRDEQWLRHLMVMSPTNEQVNVNARLFFHSARYMVEGYRTYEIDRNLAEVLRRTELEGLCGSDLHLPYRSLYIKVPPTSGLRVWNDESQWHDLAGVYLTVEDGHDYGEGAPQGLDGLSGRTLRALIVGNWEMVEVARGVKMADDALLYWSVPLVDDWPLDRCIRHHKAYARDYYGHKPSSYAHMMGGEWDDIFTWLVNVVMYATSADARAELRPFDPKAEALRRRTPKTAKNRRKQAVALNGMDRRRYTVLGRGVPSITDVKGSGIPLEKGVLVSGHWRNQACGPQWSERKRMLIEPYWRGPDGDEDAVVHRLV